MEHPNADKEMLAEMREMLEQESKKPPKKRDYNLIMELSAALHDATSSEDLAEAERQGLEKIVASNEKKICAIKKMRWLRPAVSVVACLAVFICMNANSLQGWSHSPLDVIYKINHRGDGSVDLYLGNLLPGEELPITDAETDPYGIRAKCEELGFSPMTPSYIPAEMHLFEKSEIDEERIKSLNIGYQNKKGQIVCFAFTHIPDKDQFENTVTGLAIYNNIHTEIICGRKVIIGYQDRGFHAKFCDDNQTSYTVFCRDMEYDSAYHVLVSFFT